MNDSFGDTEKSLESLTKFFFGSVFEKISLETVSLWVHIQLKKSLTSPQQIQKLINMKINDEGHKEHDSEMSCRSEH